jgi:hypothetical protein
MKLTPNNILRILTKYDLERLIELGAPQDEYLLEAKRIYRSLICLNYIPEVEYIQELIEYVFWQAFEVMIIDKYTQVEDVIVRDFSEWQPSVSERTFEMALEISELFF